MGWQRDARKAITLQDWRSTTFCRSRMSCTRPPRLRNGWTTWHSARRLRRVRWSTKRSRRRCSWYRIYKGASWRSLPNLWSVVYIAVMLQRQIRTVSNCTLSSTPLSWRRCGFPWVLEILQLQYIDKMVDLCCAGPASSGFGRENTVEIPQLQPVSWTWSFTRPFVCNDRCPMVDVLMQFIDLSHIPVIMQATLHRRSASDSVIAGDSRHSSCATEKRDLQQY